MISSSESGTRVAAIRTARALSEQARFNIAVFKVIAKIGAKEELTEEDAEALREAQDRVTSAITKLLDELESNK